MYPPPSVFIKSSTESYDTFDLTLINAIMKGIRFDILSHPEMESERLGKLLHVVLNLKDMEHEELVEIANLYNIEVREVN